MKGLDWMFFMIVFLFYWVVRGGIEGLLYIPSSKRSWWEDIYAGLYHSLRIFETGFLVTAIWLFPGDLYLLLGTFFHGLVFYEMVLNLVQFGNVLPSYTFWYELRLFRFTVRIMVTPARKGLYMFGLFVLGFIFLQKWLG